MKNKRSEAGSHFAAVMKNCRSVCAETELGNWANGFTLTKLPRLNNLPKQLTLAGGKVRDYANLVKLRKQPLER